MASDDALCQFWSRAFGLLSKNNFYLFTESTIQENGSRYLYNKIEQTVIQNKINLLFVDVSTLHNDPFWINNIKKKYNLAIVIFAFDDEFKFEWISTSFATTADLVLTCDYVSVNRYRQSGVNAHFFPLPIEIPSDEEKFVIDSPKLDVSFVGTLDDKPSRIKLIKCLEEEMDVSIFGKNKCRNSLFLTNSEIYSVFKRSTINLNFTGITTYLNINNPLSESIRGYKLRPFEILAVGGFCISEYSISLAKCLKDGIDIVYFTNETDLIAKVKYYLKHKDRANKIAKNGALKISQSYSADNIAIKFEKLIEDAQKFIGLDLYGESQRVKVSKWYATDYIVSIISNSSLHIFRGKVKHFTDDLVLCIKFILNYHKSCNIINTLAVILMAFYKIVRIGLSKVKLFLVKGVTFIK